MATLTLENIPDRLVERLQERADEEGRSLTQETIWLLEQAVETAPRSFRDAYREFREKQGPSPIEDGDLEGLRDESPGRRVEV